MDSQGNSKDITILEIVNFITEIEGPNTIIIFPNCSPIDEVSYTTPAMRSMKCRVKNMSGTMNTVYKPKMQFKLALEIIARAKNFYQGTENFDRMISSDLSFLDHLRGSSSSASSEEKNTVSLLKTE